MTSAGTPASSGVFDKCFKQTIQVSKRQSALLKASKDGLEYFVLGNIRGDGVRDAHGPSCPLSESIQYRLVARHEGRRPTGLALVAVIVTGEPVLVSVDVEVFRKAVLGQKCLAASVVIEQ